MGKSLKIDVHTIKENHNGGELNITKRGRFGRISVEINLEKKLVPRIKIRNKIYKIEYEGLNLICFNCGRYGHHKDNCPMLITDPKQPAEADKNLRNSNNNTSITEETSDPIGSQNEVFGSWMVAKKNFRNRNSTTNQRSEYQRWKTVQNENIQEEPEIQNRANLKGSRFTVLEMEEDCVGNDEAVEEHAQIVEDLGKNSLVDLQEKEENYLSTKNVGIQETNSGDMLFQNKLTG